MNALPLHTKPVRLLDGPLVDLHRNEIIRHMLIRFEHTAPKG